MCVGLKEYTERMTQTSSITEESFGRISLTSTPPDGKMGRPWIGRKERGVTEMNPRLMIVSKFLSKHLRHAPAELGLTCLGRVIP